MNLEVPKGYRQVFGQELISIDVYSSQDSRDYLVVANGYHLHLGPEMAHKIAMEYSPLEVMIEVEKLHPDFAEAVFDHRDVQQRTPPVLLALALARVKIGELETKQIF